LTILHLSASYSFTDLYKNLLEVLDNQKVKQIMYVALKNSKDANKRMIANPLDTAYIYSTPFTRIDSYIYYTKINKILKDIEQKVNLKEIDLLHAHFMFSDGGVAYQIKKKYGIDYIVAIRNTDINLFYKYGIHVRHYGTKILKSAKKIIFLSPAYKEALLENYVPAKLMDEIRRKSVIIPNGIDDFWIKDPGREETNKVNQYSISFIFVGELSENKNILATLKVIELLQQFNYNVRLSVVGTGPLFAEVEAWINKTNNELNVILHGYISDKRKLRNLYNESDIFIMPSHKETFGLVYIEAMSQGLPVIYSKGQGIDGYYMNGDIGYSVNPDDPLEIVESILAIKKDYKAISERAIKESAQFTWDKIAAKYIEIYAEENDPLGIN